MDDTLPDERDPSHAGHHEHAERLALGALQTLNPDATFSLVPFSGDDDGDRNVMTVSNAGGAAVNASTDQKEAALAAQV